ncbi:MAG: ribonuclease [Vampirovibrio sp.]|nr:ribonuclease [Vampirovibrio sp.]
MPAAKFALKQSQEKLRFKHALMALPETDWTEKTEQYCDYRLDGKASGGWLRAKQFTNGTLYLEASTDDLLVLMTGLLGGQGQVAAPKQKSLLQGGASGTSATAVVKAEKPSGLLDVKGTYIGTDESGKGDYFGPLVVAGVLVTDQTAAILTELGVMDSKKLTDARIGGMYQKILQVVGEDAVSVVEMGPAKYNQLYDRFKQSGKNLNHLLAWGHATAIENLLTAFPDCSQAIADQFGDERYILSQLKDKGKGITLHQTPRAEANVGVAAASIVARYRFTGKLKQLAARYGITLPLGAGPQVKLAAKQFVEQHGRPALAEVAKLHFKTTQEL